MRHPALTRFFAAFLAAASAITLLSGGLCVKKAAESREQQNTELSLLAGQAEDARALYEELAAAAEEYEPLDGEYDERSWQHAKDMLAFRKDLAMYTATEAGLKQGSEQIEEGYKALRTGWIQHDNALKALEEGEAKFRPGYQKYLDGKKQLAEGMEKLRQAEELKETLGDLTMLRTGLEMFKASAAELAAALSALRTAAQDPPLDPETGEIDAAALRAALGAQTGGISARLAVVRAAMSAAFGAEGLEGALQATTSALGDLSGKLADGGAAPEELIASANALAAQGETLVGAVNASVAGAEQTLTMLDNLPQMRAELEAGQAALKQSEPALLEAKKQIEEGKKQLDAAKNMLIYTEAQLIQSKKSLEEKQAEQAAAREDLDRRKTELEDESKALEALKRKVEDYAAKKDRFSNLRYALLADEGVAARVRAGGELLDSADAEIMQRRADSGREYTLRLSAAILMLLSSAAGIVTVAAAFRDRTGLRLLLPAALSLAAAAAGEAVSLYAGRGLLYTALFVGVFSAGVILLNLRKA